jgi:ubiquinone/menaquinone biosynthesis C-methylase UbiE
MKDISHEWYRESYRKHGFEAQRKYPNEEFLRFLGREYSSKVQYKDRHHIKVLELGCGSCANLWAVAKEGYNAYGIDFSEKTIDLGNMMLARWNTKAEIIVGDFRKLPYLDNNFDVVFDILSTHSQIEKDFVQCIDEVKRVLKPNGMFFSFYPSANSDAFINYKPAHKIEEFTLDGIKRPTSPYYGCFHPFRFMYPENYKKLLKQKGFSVIHLEIVTRTYRNMQERFETISISAKNRDI